MTSSVNPVIAWICGTVLLLGVVIGLFVLAWHGTISGTALLGVIATIVGLAGGMIGVHAGVTATTKSNQAAVAAAKKE